VDVTVSPFYAQLDGAYSGSKFILTVRNRESWLRSSEDHWRYTLAWWDRHDGQFKRFSQFIFACTYGTLHFNADRFRFVYDLHLRNVREYFNGRPEDLLVMDICAGDGWEKLCPFLGFEVPEIPFPHLNTQEEKAQGWRWMELLDCAAEDIAGLVPPEGVFILVDEAKSGTAVAAGRQAIPFVERDGRCWGPPADDETAIHELGRLRQRGASHIVFAWPAFWWLEHFVEFYRHLRTDFPCVLENDRVIAFDLRESQDGVSE
jgi:hypothetical protein